jgi:phosphate starvation-inducible membrane PsiE
MNMFFIFSLLYNHRLSLFDNNHLWQAVSIDLFFFIIIVVVVVVSFTCVVNENHWNLLSTQQNASFRVDSSVITVLYWQVIIIVVYWKLCVDIPVRFNKLVSIVKCIRFIVQPWWKMFSSFLLHISMLVGLYFFFCILNMRHEKRWFSLYTLQ